MVDTRIAGAAMGMVLCCASACSIVGPQAEPEPWQTDAPVTERPDDAIAEPIIGGVEASDYPEAVLVDMKQNGWTVSICSGALIAPKVVLTAGHCIVGYDGFDVFAPYAGPNGSSATAASASTFDYSETADTVNPNQHDVGLIVLSSAIAIDDYPVVAASAVASGTQIVNIGRIDDGVTSNEALFVSPALSVQSGASWGFPYAYVTDEVIQPGDSGGPDMLTGPAPHTVVAVNSGSGSGWQVLARVDQVHSWIAQVIADSESEAEPPPEQPPPDPCQGIGYEGVCDAGVLRWCEGGQLHTIDCAAASMQCGWDAGNNFYNCL